MKAIAVTPGRPNAVRLIDAPKPVAASGEALVRVLEVGVDGTDKELAAGLYGEAPEGDDYLIVGHESLGMVEETGPGVTSLNPGDLVVATVRRPDDCPNCLRGEYDMCLYGNYRERGIKGLHGFMAEYYADEPRYTVSVPGELRPVAVLLEPLSIVEKAIHQAFKIQERMFWDPRRALVLGAGTIGLLATFLLRARGLETYTLATRLKSSLKAILAEACGAVYVSAGEKPVQGLDREFGNLDIILEATGDSNIAFQAMGILGTNGVLCLTGVSAGNRNLVVPVDALNMEMVLGNRVVFGTVNASRRHFEMALEHMADLQARWPGLLERLLTRRVPLCQWRQGLDKSEDDVKVVIEMIGG
ncbi:MAG: glucose 1-dehydrogenase [Chloroflexi bacterium]|nr:glucose 1-dehydrogenase [Chloroflexota bacterium]